MADPLRASEMALAMRLKMIPSQFRRKATRWDVVQMLAWDRTENEKWRNEYQRQVELEKSRKMTSKQKGLSLWHGFEVKRDGND